MEEQSQMLELISEPVYLNPEQLARVAALKEARTVLEKKYLGGTALPEPTDLHTIAQYIVDGKDPWPPEPREIVHVCEHIVHIRCPKCPSTEPTEDLFT